MYGKKTTPKKKMILTVLMMSLENGLNKNSLILSLRKKALTAVSSNKMAF